MNADPAPIAADKGINGVTRRFRAATTFTVTHSSHFICGKSARDRRSSALSKPLARFMV
jgi:hypothetical protein